VTPEPGKPDTSDPLAKCSTDVAAVVCFFPPTDMLKFGYRTYDASNILKMPKLVLQFVFFNGNLPRRSPEEILAIFASLSPARLVHPKAPPFLLVHGDADVVVPIQQSQIMHAALTKAGVRTELVVLEGIGHGYAAMGSQIHRAADWFNTYLPEESKRATR
jgi:acetyl esterase/lipase